jgi:hypothetical protein
MEISATALKAKVYKVRNGSVIYANYKLGDPTIPGKK